MMNTINFSKVLLTFIATALLATQTTAVKADEFGWDTATLTQFEEGPIQATTEGGIATRNSITKKLLSVPEGQLLNIKYLNYRVLLNAYKPEMRLSIEVNFKSKKYTFELVRKVGSTDEYSSERFVDSLPLNIYADSSGDGLVTVTIAAPASSTTYRPIASHRVNITGQISNVD
jgi:hypothetical protein